MGVDRDNELRLSILEEKKQPYLFSSSHLVQLTDLTPSLKTRLAMICTIAPRLVDPASKSAMLKEMFRFNCDKEKIDEVLQERTRTIQSARFTNTGEGRTPILFAGAGRGAAGGRGVRRTSAPQIMVGRGVGGRGRGMSSAGSAHQLQNGACPLSSIKVHVTSRVASQSVSDFKALRHAPNNTSTASIDSEHGEVVAVDHDFLDFDASPNGSAQAAAAAAAAHGVPPLGRSPGRNKSGDDGSARTDQENFTPIGNSPSADASESSSSCSMRPGVPPRPQIRSEVSANVLKAMGMDEPPSPTNSVGSNSRAPTPNHAAALALEQHEYKSEAVAIAPGFVFTARAPQRGPSPAPRRTPSEADLASHAAASGAASTTNSSGTTTPVPGAAASSKEKKKTGSYKERVAEENAALGVSNSMVSSLRSRFQQKDSSSGSEGIAAVPSTGEAEPPTEGRRRAGVSSLVRNIAKCLSSHDNSTSSAKNGALDAQAAIAAGRIMRSRSSDDEQDASDKLRVIRLGSDGSVPQEPHLEPTGEESPLKLAMSPENGAQRNSKSFSTNTTPNQPLRRGRSSENPPDTIDKAKIDAEENFGSFTVSHSGKPPPGMMHAVQSNGADGCGFGISQSTSADSTFGSSEKRLVRRHSECNMSHEGPSSSGNVSASGGSDVASLCAAALSISKSEFLLLQEEGPLSADDVAAEGGGEKEQSFRYRELVRRNYTKEYVGLTQTELERYMTEDEFETVFKRSKVAMPLHRAISIPSKSIWSTEHCDCFFLIFTCCLH